MGVQARRQHSLPRGRSKALGAKILVLDDEPSIVEVVNDVLMQQGHEVTCTTSPQEALSLLEREAFSMLVTDVRMPSISGIEVVERARRLDARLAIIIITAVRDVNQAVQAIRLGADDYVLKPFNLQDLVEAVQVALEKRSELIDALQYQSTLKERVSAATGQIERVSRELRDTKVYLENLLHSTRDAIVTTSTDGRISFLNRGALQMLGWNEDELLGHHAHEFFDGGVSETNGLLKLLEETGEPITRETRLRHKDGSFVHVSVTFSLVPGASGKTASVLAICRDITEQKRLAQELRELSLRDGLTGLYNQRYFRERFRAEVERARRQSHPLSLVLLDLDNFKPYNDTFGHLEGDHALEAVAEVVNEVTRGSVDLGFRYGGDEFCVILTEADEHTARRIAERIRERFEMLAMEGLTLSIGVMTTNGQPMSPEAFIREADARMYQAKRDGGNRVCCEAATQHLRPPHARPVA